MPNKRSPEAMERRAQRRFARILVSKSGLGDPIQAENINILLHDQIADSLEKAFGYADMSIVDKFEKGEILSDNRGRGTLQKLTQ
jgi:hypothetical protein